DFEDGHETAVVVSSAWLLAEAEPGQQAAQDFDYGGQATALVALRAAQRQQRAAAAQLGRVGRLAAVFVDNPAQRHGLAPRYGHADLARRDRGGGHVQEEWPVEIGRHCDRQRIGADASLAAPERGDLFGGAT